MSEQYLVVPLSPAQFPPIAVRRPVNFTHGFHLSPKVKIGTTKINNNFDIVDAIGTKDGKGMTATLFVKGADEYIRVSTSVPKPDGSGRAVGTVLAGPALESIKAGKSQIWAPELSMMGS